MDIKEYEKIKDTLEKVLNRADSEALNSNVDITSPKFQSLKEMLKEKVLEKWGISTGQYDNIQKEIQEKTDLESVDINIAIDAMADLKRMKGVESDMRQTVDSIADLPNKINETREWTKQELDRNRRERQEVIDEVRKEIPKIEKLTKDKILKEHKWSDHIEFVRDLNEFEKRDNRKDQIIKSLKLELEKVKKDKELDSIEREKIDEQIVSALEKLYENNE